MPLSRTAESGFASSAAYDANRPSYIPEAVDQFLEVLKIKDVAQAQIIDLAAGTGKFTEVLAARPEKFNIIAVEPHAGMREQLANKNLSGVNVVEGTAEDMGTIADSSVVAVVTAQAFHWFSNMNTLKEVHRVLQSTGSFGMIWNIEDYHTPNSWTIHDGWETTMREEMYKLDDGLPRFRNDEWKKVFDEQSKSDPFSLHTADPLFGLPIGEDTMDTQLLMSKQAIIDRFGTYSQVANLDNDRRAEFFQTLQNALDAPDTETGDQGRIVVHNKVIWAWTTKIPSEPLQGGDGSSV